MTASVPNIFVPGTIIASGAVNANFDALVSYLNGLSIPTTPVSILNGGTGATTAGGATTNLGLAACTILPCAASIAGTVITLAQVANTPVVAAYSDGMTFVFEVPAATTGPFTIGVGALGTTVLYDGPGASSPTATASLATGQLCLVTYSGARNAFVLVNTAVPASSYTGRLLNVQVFATPGTSTYTPTTGTNAIRVTVTAAGGGGGGVAASGAGSAAAAEAGGAGATAQSYITAGISSQIVTVGAGGVAGAAGANNGAAGGSSAFGSLITCTGGQGGGTSIVSATLGFNIGAPGGVATGGNVFNTGGGTGSLCVFDGPAGNAHGSVGGASFWGGGTADALGVGQPATAYGAGGGGAASAGTAAAAGGKGGDGIVIIEEYS